MTDKFVKGAKVAAPPKLTSLDTNIAAWNLLALLDEKEGIRELKEVATFVTHAWLSYRRANNQSIESNL